MGLIKKTWEIIWHLESVIKYHIRLSWKVMTLSLPHAPMWFSCGFSAIQKGILLPQMMIKENVHIEDRLSTCCS
jgi:hypothetical protein